MRYVSGDKTWRLVGWSCGCNLVLNFVIGACQHSLFRLYLSLTSLTIKVTGNYVNMIYCWCCCNTACPCILFHPYLDTGGVSCSPLLPKYANCTSESQSNARNSTYSATAMQSSVLPPLDRCGDVCQGRRSPASSPYGAIPMRRWSSVLIGCDLGLLHTCSDPEAFSDANLHAVRITQYFQLYF